MIAALVMLAIGLALSAFFSGSETGFYRVTRLRLVIRARSGDWLSARLLWLVNNPAMFVATTLIGNNVANYLTSLAIVLLTKELLAVDSHVVELAATVLVSPLVFVYGELLPKNLYYHAPNLLLRRGAPLFLLFTVLFYPVSVLLWALGYMLQRLIGETPLRARLRLARKELQEVLREGQELGLLRPAQRSLAQNLLAQAATPIGRYVQPFSLVSAVVLGEPVEQALQKARRHKAAVLPVVNPGGKEPVGYVRLIDLRLQNAATVQDARLLLRVRRSESYIEVLTRLQSSDEDMACVIDDRGRVIGLLRTRQLAGLLFGEE